MRIGRILCNDKPIFVCFESNEAKLIQGDIFDHFEVTNKSLGSIDSVKFLPPINPPQVIAIGLNYKEHAKECNMPLPTEPLIFLKGINSVVGHKDNIILPKLAPNEVDYEAELTIVIGKKCKNIEPDQANDYILGYTCGNDVSARDCQLKKDSQWARGKSFDTFAPIGPWIETEIDNPDNLEIKSYLNGKVMQSSNTSDMIFPVAELVSFISKCMTLFPGTIIMTGTPPGIGYSRSPQVFLKEGDTIEIEIEKIGKLTNTVIKEK